MQGMSFQDVRRDAVRHHKAHISKDTTHYHYQPQQLQQPPHYQRDDVNVGRHKPVLSGVRYSPHLVVDVPPMNNNHDCGESYDSYDSYGESYDTCTSTEPSTIYAASPMRPGRKKLEQSRRRNFEGTSMSMINGEILQLKQLVASLGQQIYTLDNSSAELWKSRLQIDSMNIICKNIQDHIHSHENSYHPSEISPQIASALQKLRTDFKYVKDSFRNLKIEFGQRQKMNDLRLMEEESRKMTRHGNAPYDNIPLPQNYSEDFNYKLMREREAELNNINASVQKVSEIYNDLGQIVQSQQNQVDEIEDTAHSSNNNTSYALEQIEQANGKSCGGRPKALININEEDDNETYTQNSRQNEDKECSWPSIGDYILDARRDFADLMEYGTSVMEVSIDKFLETKATVFQCVSGRVDDYQHYRHDY